ncbi:MAG TPA: alpha/beta hydrolase, partial [Terriglobia bacterium]|nr:alpha/beta hydrolase [Terriglobia bacterium]
MKTAMTGVVVLLLMISTCANAEVKKDVEYGRADGVPLLLDAYLLDGQGPFPTMIYVHGGGFTRGDKRDLPKPLFEDFSRAGFNWISVNYRLAPKYTFPAETDDVELAVEYLKSHARDYKVDPGRLVQM